MRIKKTDLINIFVVLIDCPKLSLYYNLTLSEIMIIDYKKLLMLKYAEVQQNLIAKLINTKILTCKCQRTDHLEIYVLLFNLCRTSMTRSQGSGAVTMLERLWRTLRGRLPSHSLVMPLLRCLIMTKEQTGHSTSFWRMTRVFLR